MSSLATWPAQAESWLDERGKGAWIAAMVLGFVLFWPLGLALLFYMLWSKRMPFSCTGHGHGHRHRAHRHGHAMTTPTGNAAFDAYREETLRRLEEEQQAFQAFLDRLRRARDKAEFDQFMEERAREAGLADEGDSEPGADRPS